VFTVVRALTYASLFVGFVLVWLPARLLQWTGIARPSATGALFFSGVAVATLGAALALSCVLAFALVGRGTPAPFDPPRRLVVRGPYRLVRNPMYLGAGLALAGAALAYRSVALVAYTAALFVATHLFVVLYEEPTLRSTFGGEYEAYCRRVRRWLPRL
jgi:protein-S-isoprenylcysteine O-methyltransferase Ste14